MGQKKVAKRKYPNSKLEENKSEIGKDVTRIPDNAEVLSVMCFYTCSLFIVLYSSNLKVH